MEERTIGHGMRKRTNKKKDSREGYKKRGGGERWAVRNRSSTHNVEEWEEMQRKGSNNIETNLGGSISGDYACQVRWRHY